MSQTTELANREALRDFIQANMHRIDGFERWTFQAPVDLADAMSPHLTSAWHDAVSEAYVEGALSADQASIMWNKNPYRTTK